MMDELSITSLRSLTLAESDAKIVAAVEPLAQDLAALGNHIEQMATHTLQAVVNMTPQERAHSAGRCIGEAIIGDCLFKVLRATFKLATNSATHVAQLAPYASTRTIKHVSSLWESSLAGFKESLEHAELDILATLHTEQPLAQAAGTHYNNSLMHFNETLIQKVGPDKIAVRAAELGGHAEKAAVKSVGEKLFSLELTTARGWNLSEVGSMIENRYYTKHALERMAPATKEVIMELEARAIAKGLKKGTEKFISYVQPRDIPPSVIEGAIATVKPISGNTRFTWEYINENVKVVVNEFGDVITVYRKSGKLR